jgi:hypothetical protein
LKTPRPDRSIGSRRCARVWPGAIATARRRTTGRCPQSR